MGSAGALNATTPAAVTFGASSTGILSLNGNSVTIGNLNSGAPLGTPIVQNASATPAILTVNGIGSYSGVLQDGAGGGALSLAKSGAGNLTLSGTNTFTGGITINSGSLIVSSAGALNATTPNAVTFGASSTGNLRLAGNSVTISVPAQLSLPVCPGTTGSSVVCGTIAGKRVSAQVGPAVAFAKGSDELRGEGFGQH